MSRARLVVLGVLLVGGIAAVPGRAADPEILFEVGAETGTLRLRLPAEAGEVPVVGVVRLATDPEDVLRSLSDLLVDGGVAAFTVAVPAADRQGRRWLEAAFAAVRGRAQEFGLAPDAMGVHAHQQAVQAVLDFAMEPMPRFLKALSIEGESGYVIETLRDDLPALLLDRTENPTHVRRGLLEMAHQLALSGAPCSLRTVESREVDAAVADFHRFRLAKPPAAADVAGPAEALEWARTSAARQEVESCLAWLELARELGGDPAGGRVLDLSFGPVRAEPAFRRWLEQHSEASELTLTAASEPGRRISIQARIEADSGRLPVAGAQVLAYQTDATGLYTHGEGGDVAARLFGYLRSDADGRFTLHTILPGGYPRTLIPAHIHLHIEAAGFRPRQLEFVFDADPRMSSSARARAAALRWPVVELDDEGTGEARILLTPTDT